jgi:spoIIIJ-associated protein
LDSQAKNAKILSMDKANQVLEAAQDLLSKTGYENIVVNVDYDTENNLYYISLQSDNPAPLIGYHGDTLGALQTMLSQHLFTKTGEWLSLTVNVNDYRERRENALKAMADAAVNKVTTSGKAFTLPPLPANERRIIHMYLSERSDITTESVGEGRGRSVVITPKLL